MTLSAFTQNADLSDSEQSPLAESFNKLFFEFEENLSDLRHEQRLERSIFNLNILPSEDLSQTRFRQDNIATAKIGPLNRAQHRRAKALKPTNRHCELIARCGDDGLKPIEPGADIVRDADLVVAELCGRFKVLVVGLFGLTNFGASVRQLEEESWKLLLQMGQQLLGHLFARRSAQVSEAEIKKHGFSPESVYLRMDEDYHIGVTTTLGEIVFPLCAFRVKQADGKLVTYSPAREELFPYHKQCHSSELCLEWTSRLGSQQTFRESESSLSFFSHNAVNLADNTIATHTVKVGSVIDRVHLYHSPAKIREILATRATRDRKTCKPIVYFSTDAHALRRFVDETWHGAWKMANGLRIWCIDQESDQIIHLGGEYTWGDCEAVENIFKSLTESGHLPANGDYGDSILAQYVIVTDGAAWIEQRIVPIFHGSYAILDAYHALETVSKYAKEIYGSETPEANDFYRQAVSFLLGETERTKSTRKNRKGHKKTRKSYKQILPNMQDKSGEPYICTMASNRGTPSQIEAVIEFIQGIKILESKEDIRQRLIDFLRGNTHRIDYIGYRNLGYKIGSGAMESLHRTASQKRLKIPGARWLKETAQSIFNIRMMTLVGKWNDFWTQPNIIEKLTLAFNSKSPMAAD